MPTPYLLVATSVSLALSALQDPKPPRREAKDRAVAGSSLEGNRVRIGRRGPKLELPEAWVEKSKTRRNLHLDPTKLGKTKVGDFDREYGELVDAVFDLQDCGLHAGDEGWGPRSSSYADLQMRVYVVETPLAELLKRIERKGAKALHRILSPGRVKKRNASGGFRIRKPKQAKDKKAPKPYEPPTEAELRKLLPENSKAGKWQRRVFRFYLGFGDYGAKAIVDVRARRFGGHTVALVFLHTDFRKQDAKINGVLPAAARWANLLL